MRQLSVSETNSFQTLNDQPNFPKRILELDNREFEQFIAALWRKRGWHTELTPTSGDRGIDVIATREAPFPQKHLIQVKRYAPDNLVGGPELSRYASLQELESKADVVIVVTTSDFTEQARQLADELNVKMVNLESLVSLIVDEGHGQFVRDYFERDIDFSDINNFEQNDKNPIGTYRAGGQFNEPPHVINLNCLVHLMHSHLYENGDAEFSSIDLHSVITSVVLDYFEAHEGNPEFLEERDDTFVVFDGDFQVDLDHIAKSIRDGIRAASVLSPDLSKIEWMCLLVPIHHLVRSRCWKKQRHGPEEAFALSAHFPSGKKRVEYEQIERLRREIDPEEKPNPDVFWEAMLKTEGEILDGISLRRQEFIVGRQLPS